MKRDVDLARQLLLDIENRGADCSVRVLRSGPNQEAQDRVRYHLLLLIDAGYLKEIDRTDAGVPCVRLTDAGHELIELVRHEAQWRDAKWDCQQRLGGLSLSVIRGIILEWDFEGQRYAPRRRYVEAGPMPFDGRYRGRRSAYRFEPYVENGAPVAMEDDVRYIRVRPAYRNGWQLREVAEPTGVDRAEPAPSLPGFLI
jgi:hypothetical protein